MLRRILICSTLALAQAGCSVEEGVGPYKLTLMTEQASAAIEALQSRRAGP